MIKNGHMSNQEYHESSSASTQQQYNHRNATTINNQDMTFPPPRHEQNYDKNDVRSTEQTNAYNNTSQTSLNVARGVARNNNTNNDRAISNGGNYIGNDPQKVIRPKAIPLPREGKPPSTSSSNTAYKLQPREPPLPPQTKYVLPSLSPVVRNKSNSSSFIKVNQDLMPGKAFVDPSCNGNTEACSDEFDPINYHIIECSSCQKLLKIPKFASLAMCPYCQTTSPNSTTSL